MLWGVDDPHYMAMVYDVDWIAFVCSEVDAGMHTFAILSVQSYQISILTSYKSLPAARCHTACTHESLNQVPRGVFQRPVVWPTDELIIAAGLQSS